MDDTSERRLFVGGLFDGITENDLRDRFKKFAEIDGVDIRSRKDDQGNIIKTFAYLDTRMSEKSFKQCMATFNKSKWKGTEVQIQIAKESFMDRLKREREAKPDPDAKKETPEKSPVELYVKGAVPGTQVEGKENWVVGKYGRALPVVKIRTMNRKKVVKVDPSKYVHAVKMFDHKKKETVPDEPETSITGLTWNMDVEETDTLKKIKGEFPKTPKRKTRKNQSSESESESGQSAPPKKIKTVYHSSSDSDSDSDDKSKKVSKRGITSVNGVTAGGSEKKGTPAKRKRTVSATSTPDSDSKAKHASPNVSLIEPRKSKAAEMLEKIRKSSQNIQVTTPPKKAKKKMVMEKSPEETSPPHVQKKGPGSLDSSSSERDTENIIERKSLLDKQTETVGPSVSDTEKKKVKQSKMNDHSVGEAFSSKVYDSSSSDEEDRTKIQPTPKPTHKTKSPVSSSKVVISNELHHDTKKTTSDRKEKTSRAKNAQKDKVNKKKTSCRSVKYIQFDEDIGAESDDEDESDEGPSKRKSKARPVKMPSPAKAPVVPQFAQIGTIDEFGVGVLVDENSHGMTYEEERNRRYDKGGYSSDEDFLDAVSAGRTAKLDRLVKFANQRAKFQTGPDYSENQMESVEQSRVYNSDSDGADDELFSPIPLASKKPTEARTKSSSTETSTAIVSKKKATADRKKIIPMRKVSSSSSESSDENLLSKSQEKITKRSVLTSNACVKKTCNNARSEQGSSKASVVGNKAGGKEMGIKKADSDTSDSESDSETKTVPSKSVGIKSKESDSGTSDSESDETEVVKKVPSNIQRTKSDSGTSDSESDDENEKIPTKSDIAQNKESDSGTSDSESDDETEVVKKVPSNIQRTKSDSGTSDSESDDENEKNATKSDITQDKESDSDTSGSDKSSLSMDLEKITSSLKKLQKSMGTKKVKSLLQNLNFKIASDSESGDEPEMVPTKSSISQNKNSSILLDSEIVKIKAKTAKSQVPAKKNSNSETVASKSEGYTDGNDSDTPEEHVMKTERSGNHEKLTNIDNDDSHSQETSSSDSDDSSLESTDKEKTIEKYVKSSTTVKQNKTLTTESVAETKVNEIVSAKKQTAKEFAKSVGLTQNAKDISKIPNNTKKNTTDNAKRLESLKQRTREAQNQKKLIQQALSSIDSSSKSKKIVFDSDSEEEVQSGSQIKQKVSVPKAHDTDDTSSEEESTGEEETKSDKKSKTDKEVVKKGPALFEESAESSDDEDRFKIKPQFEGPSGGKLMSLQTRFASDSRFKMSEIFLEDEAVENEEHVKEKGDKKKSGNKEEEPMEVGMERDRALEILKSVVGSAATKTERKDKSKKFRDMGSLRYDPTTEDHEQFEVKMEKKPKTSKKKKKKVIEEPTQEEEPVPEVSGDRFFEVQSSLKEAFNTSEQTFSMLAMLGRGEDEPSDTKIKQEDGKGKALEKTKMPWHDQFALHASDDEEKEEQAKADKKIAGKKTVDSSQSKAPQNLNRFFCNEKDPRIQEGREFFSQPEDMEKVRETWTEERPDLVEAYRQKRKRIRFMKQSANSVRGGKPGGRGRGGKFGAKRGRR